MRIPFGESSSMSSSSGSGRTTYSSLDKMAQEERQSRAKYTSLGDTNVFLNRNDQK
jgi:hypothetical protein